MTNLTAPLLFAGAISLLATMSFADEIIGDAASGEGIFKKCKACHQVGEDAKNRTGPVLNNVIGRPAASFEGYKYSKSMTAAGEAGLVWDVALLTAYLEDPRAFLREFLSDDKAKSKMTLKLRKEQDRADVAAYVATFSTEMEPEAEAATE